MRSLNRKYSDLRGRDDPQLTCTCIHGTDPCPRETSGKKMIVLIYIIITFDKARFQPAFRLNDL